MEREEKWIEQTGPSVIYKPCFHWPQPWLSQDGHGDGVAHYSIEFNKYRNGWKAGWWHGNRGYGVDGIYHDTKEEAQKACEDHLQSMKAALAPTQAGEMVPGRCIVSFPANIDPTNCLMLCEVASGETLKLPLWVAGIKGLTFTPITEGQK